MESSISVALASQVALRRRLDVVANNVANAGTTGFKLESQIVQARTRGRGEGEVVYPLDRGSFTSLKDGPLSETGHALDVAVEGGAFLAVRDAGGEKLTRDGRLRLAPDGTLQGSSGAPVVAVGGGSIQIPVTTRSIVITGDGTVIADRDEVGQIGLFAGPEDGALRRGADNLFTMEGAPQPAENARLHQGVLEDSNVAPIVEITDLIELQRGYDRVQQMLDGEDDRIRKLIDRAVRV